MPDRSTANKLPIKQIDLTPGVIDRNRAAAVASVIITSLLQTKGPPLVTCLEEPVSHGRMLLCDGRAHIPHLFNKPKENVKYAIQLNAHGNEQGASEMVLKEVINRWDDLPPFLLIPGANPFGLSAGRRENIYGENPERYYNANELDAPLEVAEAKNRLHEIIERQNGVKGKMYFAIHEDPERNNGQYLAYCGKDGKQEFINKFLGGRADGERGIFVDNFYARIKNLGIDPLNEIDEPDELPEYQWDVKNGVHFEPAIRNDGHSIGAAWEYAVKKDLFEGAMVLEVPGKLDAEIKKQIVQAFFEEVVLPMQKYVSDNESKNIRCLEP